ncbi:hypothetical protein EDF57_106218 [Novosphingobium sp. PhB55]|nr:hypothetical protein EDF57_106218 [Novosphingobium sp. PhB55]
MASNRFHVLRIQCERLAQSELFEIERTQAEVISIAIMKRPSAFVRRNVEWHIGAPENIEDGGVVFQLGRVQSVNAPQFDDVRHAFFEADSETAPFTWGVFDKKTQACGILKKSGVSLNPSEIAAKLEQLLNASGVPAESGYTIYVEVIPDPESFVESLFSAHKVVRFSFTARYENAFDVSRLIQRPAEEFNELVGGKETTVEVKGDDLNRQVLEELTRGVASVGEAASAMVRAEPQSRLKKVFLRGTPLFGEFMWSNEKISPFEIMLHTLRDTYNRMRRFNGD